MQEKPIIVHNTAHCLHDVLFFSVLLYWETIAAKKIERTAIRLFQVHGIEY